MEIKIIKNSCKGRRGCEIIYLPRDSKVKVIAFNIKYIYK